MFSYKKFEELLAKNNISAYRVSKDTGLYSPLFSEWKSGKSCPKIDKIKILADYFGVSIEYFMKEKVDRKVRNRKNEKREEDTK